MRLSNPVFLIIVALISLSFATDSFDTTRSGRKIQVDGFLMDWMEKYRHAWTGSTLWSWDAINAADGVSGYFHASGVPACSSWVFKVETGRPQPFEMVASTANDTETTFYCVNRTLRGNKPLLTVEWVIAWDSITVDGNGAYSLTISGKSACGDSLEPVLLTGKMAVKSTSLPKNFTLRLFVILFLSIVFVAVQLRIRKKIRRKESPHQ